VNYKNPLYNK